MNNQPPYPTSNFFYYPTIGSGQNQESGNFVYPQNFHPNLPVQGIEGNNQLQFQSCLNFPPGCFDNPPPPPMRNPQNLYLQMPSNTSRVDCTIIMKNPNANYILESIRPTRSVFYAVKINIK